MFAVGDVPGRAFVILNAAQFVAHRAGIHRDPDLASVLAEDLMLETSYRILLLEQSLEFFPASRVDIRLSRNIVPAANQLFRRIKPLHASQRGVSGYVSALRSCLKDPLAGVLKDVAVPLFG